MEVDRHYHVTYKSNGVKIVGKKFHELVDASVEVSQIMLTLYPDDIFDPEDYTIEQLGSLAHRFIEAGVELNQDDEDWGFFIPDGDEHPYQIILSSCSIHCMDLTHN